VVRGSGGVRRLRESRPNAPSVPAVGECCGAGYLPHYVKLDSIFPASPALARLVVRRQHPSGGAVLTFTPFARSRSWFAAGTPVGRGVGAGAFACSCASFPRSTHPSHLTVAVSVGQIRLRGSAARRCMPVRRRAHRAVVGQDTRGRHGTLRRQGANRLFPGLSPDRRGGAARVSRSRSVTRAALQRERL
jgi:hypothetical protein